MLSVVINECNMYIGYLGFCPDTLSLGRGIANIKGDGVWGCAPSGVQGQSPWSGGLSPQKLKAFRCVSSKFLYFLGAIIYHYVHS